MLSPVHALSPNDNVVDISLTDMEISSPTIIKRRRLNFSTEDTSDEKENMTPSSEKHQRKRCRSLCIDRRVLRDITGTKKDDAKLLGDALDPKNMPRSWFFKIAEDNAKCHSRTSI